jgi:cyanophycinase
MRVRLSALKTLIPLAAALMLAAAPAAEAAQQPRGPDKGTLIIAGGGKLGPEVVGRFIALAGGPQAQIVVIPTAGEDAAYGPDCDCLKMFRALGATNLTVLHTRDKAQADTAAFAAPLTKATAVWFVGGRHWRLVDSYAGTRTEAEIKALLARGGVVGGTSAGASIQASYLVRGAREGNEIMMAPGYEQGFGLMQGVAIDQHVTARHRESDLDAVVEKHPDLLGIGIDQSTAIEVTRHRFKVIGVGHAFIHDGKEQPNGGRYYLLRPGERFDLDRVAVTTEADDR